MTTVRLIPFRVEHAECMEIRGQERMTIDMLGSIAALADSICVTGIVDGRVLCCGGVRPYGNGNAEIWLLPSIYVKQYQKTFCRELKKWLFGVRDDLSLVRMQTSCLDDASHEAWMAYLGFEKEGIMRSYHAGQNYAMWGRVWD